MTRRFACACVLMLSILSMALVPVAGNAGRATVICRDGHEVVIYTDRTGAPADPLAPCDCPACAHCLPVSQATLTTTFHHQVRRSLTATEFWRPMPALTARPTGTGAFARGPPARKELI